jgi:class 3 adenylate cyclase
MNQWLDWLRLDRRLSITAKFALAFGMLLLLIAQVAITGFSSLNVVVRETDAVIVNSVKVQQLVGEMNSALKDARLVERDFFFYWQVIGFNQARDTYVSQFENHISAVTAAGGRLQDLLNQSSMALRQSNQNVRSYLEVVEDYARNFRQALQIIGELNLENVGKLAELNLLSRRIQEQLRLTESQDLVTAYQDFQNIVRSYVATKQDNALNIVIQGLQKLRERTLSTIRTTERPRFEQLLTSYEKIIRDIFQTITEIDGKLRGLNEQTQPLSQNLLNIANQEVIRARLQIDQINDRSRILLIISAGGALMVAWMIAQLFLAALRTVQVEKSKSEQLLLNILPSPIAERLKRKTETIADSFPSVTVMFADLVGFTQLSERMSPIELVEMLNVIFSEFDYLAEKYGLEKIKTIGDAYMVVGGLPVYREDHLEAIAHMALAMRENISRYAKETGLPFEIRIGINTGPVVAGVIGTRKYIYDLWGDTVNIASRMESQGIAGCIQVTEVAYRLLKDQFAFTERGWVDIKGKGQMRCYILNGLLNGSNEN